MRGIPGVVEAHDAFCGVVAAKIDAVGALGKKCHAQRNAERTEFFEALQQVCVPLSLLA